MAPKPKKANKIPAGERPKQLSPLAKTVKSAARGGVGVAGPSYKGEYITAGEAAVRANRIRKKEAEAKARAKSGKASTSYSPSEMSKPAQGKLRDRAMEKQVSKYGVSKDKQGQYKINSGKPKRGAKAGSSVVSKVVGRAKTVAREVRDIKTAVGTSLRDQEQNVRRAAMGVKPTGKNVGKNIRTQIKEVGTAIKSGKKGTSSDMYSRPGAYTKGTKRK